MLSFLMELDRRLRKRGSNVIHAATAADVCGGDYYGPRGFLEIGGKTTKKARVNPMAKNVDIAKRLWALSESMTGVSYLSGV